MGNNFVNAFAVLEPSAGRDGFSRRQPPRKPAAHLEARAGMNRLFRSNQALPTFENAGDIDTPETTTSFVVEHFLKRPKMA